MGIFYGMVARGNVVLAEFSAMPTNASAIARQIIEKTQQVIKDSNALYSQDRYIFHVKRADGLTILCVAGDAIGRRIPFAFLEDIHQKFARTYGRSIFSAPAYAMNEELSRVLGQAMDKCWRTPYVKLLVKPIHKIFSHSMSPSSSTCDNKYTDDPNADGLNRLQGEMDQVRNVMIDNIEKVLDRGDRLALLVEKTTTLQGSAVHFKRHSRRFQNTIWWRNFKLKLTLMAVLLISVYFVLGFICYGPFLASCLK